MVGSVNKSYIVEAYSMLYAGIGEAGMAVLSSYPQNTGECELKAIVNYLLRSRSSYQ